MNDCDQGASPLSFPDGPVSPDEAVDIAFSTLNTLGVSLPDGDEEAEREFVVSFLDAVSEDNIVWDIGAHGGLFSIATRLARDPEAIVSFEPNPYAYASLKRALDALSGRNTSLNVALSDEDGREQMAVDPDGGTASTFHATDSIVSEESGYETVTVETRRGDSVAQDGVETPDVVKIDVEGAEDRVLNGMAGILEEAEEVFVEVHHLDRRFEEVDEHIKRLRMEATVLATRYQTDTCYQEFVRLSRRD